MDLSYSDTQKEHWNIIVPQIPGRYSLGRQTLQPVYLLFTKDNDWNAWSKLAKLSSCTLDVSDQTRQTETTVASATGSLPAPMLSRLEALPAELHQMIVSTDTLKPKDLIALGLVSGVIRPQILIRVLQLAATVEPDWADCEVGCFDMEYSYINLPDWVHNVRATWSSYCDRGNGGPRDTKWKRHFKALCTRGCQISDRLEGIRDEFVAASCGLVHPSIYMTWALRNLVSNEYVRCYRDAGDRQTWVETDQRFPIVKTEDSVTNKRLSIEDVLLMRFCVIFDRHRKQLRKSFSDPLPLITDNWAGHRFDMIRLDGKIPLGAEYRDVTAEVVEEATQLFESVHGKFRMSCPFEETVQQALSKLD